MAVKNILVPVDFSPCSVRALRRAVEYAYFWDATVHILHTESVPSSYFAYGEPVLDLSIERASEDSESAFYQLEEEVPLLGVIPYKKKVLPAGLVSAVISEVAQSAIDMIVMGTRSEHNQIESIFGSYASEILNSVKIPVLVIPEADYEIEVHKMGIAVDARSVRDIEKLETIFKIGANEYAELYLFFVGKDDELVDFRNSAFTDIFEGVYKSNKCYFKNIQSQHPLDGIKKYIEEEQLDMLVVFPKHRSIFERILKGSVSRKLAMELKIPLLAIPD